MLVKAGRDAPAPAMEYRAVVRHRPLRSPICWLRFPAGVATLLLLFLPTAATASRDDAHEKAGPTPTLQEIRLTIEKGRYAEAEALARRRLKEVEARGGAAWLEAADVLDPLVEALWRGGKSRPPETRALAERALAIREKLQGPEHPDVAVSLSNLCNLLRELSELDLAEPLAERALAIREKALGPEHPDVAMSLHDLVRLLYRRGGDERARPLGERALAIAERALGRDHPKVGTIINELATVLKLFEPERSRALFERAIAIQEKALGPEHPELARCLTNQAIHLSYTFTDWKTAELLFERALAMAEKTLGPEHPEVARNLFCAGAMFRRLGDYERARPMYERALIIREKALGPEEVFVAMILVDLGYLLMNLGEFEAARPLIERALAIQEKIHGPQHRDVVLPLDNLAAIHIYLGEYEQALALLERSSAIKDKYPSDSPSAPAMLAHIARKRGESERARALYEQALALEERFRGPKHFDVASHLHGLAGALCDLGECARALPLLERALAVREKSLGPDHPAVAMSLEALAELALQMGDPGRAMAAALRAEAIGREHLALAAPVLAEREALGYAAQRASGLDVALSVAAAQDGKAAGSAGKSWDALVRARALVLDEMAARHRSALAVEGPEVARLVGELAAASQRLANLAVRKRGDDDPERYRKLLDGAREEKEQAERTLAAKSRGFRDLEARSRVGLGEVAAALAPGTVLVAFVRYALHSQAKREAVSSYLAFTLAPGSAEPKLVPLGSAAEIETLVSRWREEVARGATLEGGTLAKAERTYREAGEALRRKVWDPVAVEVGAAQRVFVVPDGALQLVNLAALPSGAESYLVETGPELHYLSAERDLIRPPRPDARGQGFLVLADPDFEATNRFAAIESRKSGASPKQSSPVSLAMLEQPLTPFRGARSSCGDFATLRFEPLVATRVEAEEVVELWERDDSRRPAALSLTGAEATEAAFKASAPGRQVLHLATHGFFLGGQCRSALERRTRGIGAVGEETKPLPARSVGENPLLLSGLALAGANHRNVAGTEEEDGVLTAEEIAALDLAGVEWAVLSACDTGLGEIRSGEGVLGLRRAFEVAGAGTLVMSLWAVEDEAAREWMRALYAGRFVRDLDAPAAVREASLSVLRERRARGESTHPCTWAGFVAAGDWR